MQDREGNIWIGTAFSGLYLFYDGAFSNFNNIPALRNNYITAIRQPRSIINWNSKRTKICCSRYRYQTIL
ncbi:MAG: hypothetical protein IPL12_14285 [Bacteroidetes bacterium]|nr:hypothetical protein [Bacteroidota bacterium]